ncbi:two component transcriptional regulator, LytTR family [Humidesulfovibrio mexicanus]|uniref:Two component transcriptional regulator, LytTR family n=1 Tax=Humidesulfovibrio mexicanus TaxID=147047 RepID=A0A239CNQ0_9BACT|nr:LytTR family DNA-binding domain-containing protein [Humidesulfovibrio mexicanus]SNS21569.1 two component transcriptional regulator, LytTR family [Humidesulfovibrio mexicanus]
MAKLKTLLLHPDPIVRRDLRRALSGAGFLSVLGEAVTAFEAMELIEAIPYGALFVGLDLPGGVSGLELAQMLSGRKNKPALVFLAGSEVHAYAAIEQGATDYLIWPAPEERVQKTLAKLSEFKARFREVPMPATWSEAAPPAPGFDSGPGGPDGYGGWAEGEGRTVSLPLEDDEQEHFLSALKQAWDTNQTRTPEIEKLAVSQDGRMFLVPYGQIVFVEAYEDYSYVHTAQQKYLTSYRVKYLEERLAPHRFFRVHRKYLVNLDMVTEIASLPGSNFMLRTAGRTRIELPISRRRIASLKQVLGF